MILGGEPSTGKAVARPLCFFRCGSSLPEMGEKSRFGTARGRVKDGFHLDGDESLRRFTSLAAGAGMSVSTSEAAAVPGTVGERARPL